MIQGMVSPPNGKDSVFGLVKLAVGTLGWTNILIGNGDVALTGKALVDFYTTYSTKAATGQISFPGGIIIKWGTSTSNIPERTSQAVAFSSAFPTACLAAVGVTTTHLGSAASECAITAFTASNITWKSGAGDATARGFRWLAIGH